MKSKCEKIYIEFDIDLNRIEKNKKVVYCIDINIMRMVFFG